MVTYYSQKTGLASDETVWNTVRGGGGASADLADGDTFVVQAGHVVTWDLDTSAWPFGLLNPVIEGGATPGTLQPLDAAGTYWLKLKTGGTLSGTTSTNRGRLFSGSGSWASPTPLAIDRKFVIDCQNTARIDAANLDILLLSAEPSYKSVRTYGTKYTVTGSAANDTLTKVAHGWANGTAIRVQSTLTLPAPLVADTTYYVVNATADTFKVATVSGGTALNLTTDGTGTVEAYSGHTNVTTGAMNVLNDVTGDSCWVTTAEHNAVILADEGPADADVQVTTLADIAAGVITLATNVNSVQYPGARIWLASRNISIRSNGTPGGNGAVVDWGSSTFTGSTLRCELRQTGAVAGYGVYGGVGHTFSGALTNWARGVYYGSGHTVSGTVAGCTNGVYYGSGHTISGTVAGCTNGVSFGSGHTVSGTVAGCTYGVYSGSGQLRNAVFTGNAVDINLQGGVWPGYAAALASGTRVSDYKYTSIRVGDIPFGVQVDDLKDAALAIQPGFVGAWRPGGYTLSEVYAAGEHGTPPVTLAFVHESVFQDNHCDNWVEWPVLGQADLPVSATFWGKLSTVSDWTTRPTLEICDPNRPWKDGAEVLASATMAENTDWQTLAATYTPTYDRPLVIRVRGRGGNSGGTGTGKCWWRHSLERVARIPLVGVGGLVG